MSKDELLDLLGSLYQTVSARLAQNENPTGEAAVHDAALLDILAHPEARPLSQAQDKLHAAAAYYWANLGPGANPTGEDSRGAACRPQTSAA